MKYPVGIQSFGEIRSGNWAYVDKTALIYRLVQTGKYYFLSRPRRFGKSLLLSTLASYFLGQKDLFAGLSIEGLESEWKAHPVFHIDMNIGEYDSVESLEERLNVILSRLEDEYGSNEHEKRPADRLDGLIMRARAKTGAKVVILVDEYDKPLLSAIGKPEVQERMRDILRSFYSPIKSQDENLRFAMLTGVTKFGHLSVFSGLNNLLDISFSQAYADICGISDSELSDVFAPAIRHLADVLGYSEEDMQQALKDRYDGYRFTKARKWVYNPFSLLCSFQNEELADYWFATGTPRYLVDLLRMHHYQFSDLEGSITTQEAISAMDPYSSDPLPVIYQSGYLTIKDYCREDDILVLGFPNQEVRRGLMKYLIPYYVPDANALGRFGVDSFRREIESGRARAFMNRLKSLTADISYEIQVNCENDFQNLLYILFSLASQNPVAERRTGDGRIDMVVETSRFVYVMEFKIDGSAAQAMAQIDAKEYALPWASGSRPVIKIGANFSTSARRLTDFEIEGGIED